MTRASLAHLPASATAWLLRVGRSRRVWDEAQLRDALRRCGARNVDALVEWERELHAFASRCEEGDGAVLELPDRSFGAIWAIGRFMQDATARLPGDGRQVVVVGALHAGGRLALDEQGTLYRLSYDGATTLLAEHPAVHLARVAVEAAAAEDGSLHLVLGGRRSSAGLAAELGLSELDAASDGVQRVWRADSLVVSEGDVDAPSSDVSHAFAARSHVPELMAACRALGLEGGVLLLPHTTVLRPLLCASGACPHSVFFQYRPLLGRGNGWVSLRDSADQPEVEQVVFVDGCRIGESLWPDQSEVVYTLVEDLEGLSSQGAARLRELSFQRDLRLTAGTAEFEALLALHGLPAYPHVLEIERRLGGLRCPVPGPGGVMAFGAYQMLTCAEAAEHQEMAAESETLQGSDWPRVIHEGKLLVPVGASRELTLYADPSGTLVAHDWLMDDVSPRGREPMALFERWLLELVLGRRRVAGLVQAIRLAPELAGRLAAELGLPRATYASDEFSQTWEGEAMWLVANGTSAHLWASYPGDVERARAWLDAVVREGE